MIFSWAKHLRTLGSLNDPSEEDYKFCNLLKLLRGTLFEGFFALSDNTKEGLERRATNLLKHLRNASEVIWGTTSKGTALVEQQVNN